MDNALQESFTKLGDDSLNIMNSKLRKSIIMEGQLTDNDKKVGRFINNCISTIKP